MKTLTLDIPDSLDVDNRDLAMLVSTRLYEQGKLSLGQAAEVAGLTKRTFAELLGRYNVSIFSDESKITSIYSLTIRGKQPNLLYNLRLFVVLSSFT